MILALAIDAVARPSDVIKTISLIGEQREMQSQLAVLFAPIIHCNYSIPVVRVVVANELDIQFASSCVPSKIFKRDSIPLTKQQLNDHALSREVKPSTGACEMALNENAGG
jgi:hypothetical protein